LGIDIVVREKSQFIGNWKLFWVSIAKDSNGRKGRQWGAMWQCWRVGERRNFGDKLKGKRLRGNQVDIEGKSNLLELNGFRKLA
jgi:hypothetical protein